MSASLAYRPEIDGLRAVAVAAVVVFHVEPLWLPGGFLGVDVFFVISGYLITTIIQRALDAGRFSLGGFWARRIKRLYPALFVMIACVALGGNYILINPERGELFGQAVGALLSFSNVLLWQTTGGYWDNSSESIALLHTWSLSLEEQFYIVFPPLLMAIHKVARARALTLTLVVAGVSLALSVYLTAQHRSAAFYLLPTRMWELAIGSVLAMAQLSGKMPTPPSRVAAPLASLGVVAILASIFLIENDERFPGALPLFPCLGTALVLAFASADGVSKRCLSCGPVVYVGRISYSLYLWHWPVIVFGRFLSPAENTLALVTLPVIFASLSHHFIENPFRAGFRGSVAAGGAMITGVVLCLIPIAVADESPGMPAGLADLEADEQLTRARKYEATPALRRGPHGVTFGVESDTPDVVVVGSSHARVLTPPIADFVAGRKRNLEVFATSGMGVAHTAPFAKKRYAGTVHANRIERLSTIRSRVAVVADMWTSQTKLSGFDAELRRLLGLLSDRSGQVLVVSQIPMVRLPSAYQRAFNKYMLATTRSGRAALIEPDERVTAANAVVEAIVRGLGRDNVAFIDVYPALITDAGKVKIFDEGRLLYFDNHHVNHNGAAYVFERALRAPIDQAMR